MKNKSIMIRISESEHQKLKEYALKYGDISVSALLRLAVVKYIENEENSLKNENTKKKGVK